MRELSDLEKFAIQLVGERGKVCLYHVLAGYDFGNPGPWPEPPGGADQEVGDSYHPTGNRPKLRALLERDKGKAGRALAALARRGLVERRRRPRVFVLTGAGRAWLAERGLPAAEAPPEPPGPSGAELDALARSVNGLLAGEPLATPTRPAGASGAAGA